MSDTKWRKLFAALDLPDLKLDRCLWKIVGRDDEVSGHLPKRAHLHTPHAYIDTLDFGPLPLRSIEWLLIPSGSDGASQDVARAAEIAAGLGRYPIEAGARGLLVRGYLPAS